MRFTPKSEKELQEAGLLKPGVYPFEVISSEEKRSQKGNEMIVIKLRVYGDGGERRINDYLLESMAFKLFHFCQNAGLGDAYARGEVSATSLMGRSGFVKLGIEEGDGDYPAKNIVKDYVQDPQKAIKDEEAKRGPLGVESDSIPF